MQIKKKLKKGFTLLELLLYISLYSILMMSVVSVLLMILQVRVKNKTIAEVDQQGIQIMQMMTQKIRNANVINTPATGATGNSLSLDMPGTTNDPTIFDVTNGQVRIKEGSGNYIVLNNSLVTVSNFSISNLSRANTHGNIRVEFTITYTNTTGRSEYDYSKTFVADASLR